MSNSRVIIFDTTLRDGEQSPGASMSKHEKLRIAKVLEKMQVDIIEAGFAVASPGDYEAVKLVADNIRNTKVCSLARALELDLDRAAGALKNAAAGRIHTFIATSPIHMKFKLKMRPEEVVEQAVSSVRYARNLIDDVEFSLEDASRSELDFMCLIIEKVIEAGASTINIPDTVGYALPQEFALSIENILQRVPNADKAVFSVHCHNDLGLAVANSLAAINAGARQVECTINGLGERAGNASLEEVAMALHTRREYLQLYTSLDHSQIVPASKLVSSITGFVVQPNKAIVGANAFAHESGIHQDGILKHRETYEIMRAEDVGWSTNRLVMGKHSGRAAFKARLEELGSSFNSDAQLNAAFARFKELADKKHEIVDADLISLVSVTQSSESYEKYHLSSLAVNSQTGEVPMAKVSLVCDGLEQRAESIGDGPVDAALRAIENIVKSGTTQQLYSVNAITSGTDSQGEVTVRLEKNGRIVNGIGADTDIIIASAKAYIHALNLLDAHIEKPHPQV
ncbi:2-isopropylmalate synthase ['Osedax' symbiont bacterium Rs2_46_30_T18]|nr:2-isopropylmalate synthase ['Osedax' symbiont bacterium Rs2_46_30_T18]